MTTPEKIGLYGTGTADVVKAREDAKKAAAHALSNFSKNKTYNCTVQPKPKTAPPAPQA